MDYITLYDNYEGYDYVINNYQDFLTIEERKRLINKGKKLFDQLKLKHIHISITHEKSYAVAHAIAEK